MAVDSYLVYIKCLPDKEIAVSKSKLIDLCPTLRPNISSATGSSNLILELPYPHDVVAQFASFIEIGLLLLTSVDNAFALYKLGKEYQIDLIIRKCQKFLESKIKYNNVCTIYEFSYEQNDDVLQYPCWTTFDIDYKKVLSGEEFLHCKEVTIYRYLSRPIYKSLKEIHLFLAIYAWSKMRSFERTRQESHRTLKLRNGENEIRNIMEPFIPYIRFLVISLSELELHVFNLNLLTSEETKGIRHYHKTKDMMFLPRTISRETRMRTDQLDAKLYEYKNRRNVKFTDDIIIKGSKFYCEIIVYEDCFITKIDIPIDFNTKEHLLINFHGRNLTKNEKMKKCQLYSKLFGIMKFENPILLEKNNHYILEANLDIKKPDKFVEIRKNTAAYMTESEFKKWKMINREKYLDHWDKFFFTLYLYF